MIIPKFGAKLANRGNQALHRRQAGLGVAQFTSTTSEAVKTASTFEETSTRAVITTNSATSSTHSTSALTNTTSTTIVHATDSISSLTPSSSTITSTSSSSSSAPSSTTAVTLTTTIAPPTRPSLIFVNSFPTDFPVQTDVKPDRADAGRGYVFLKNNELGDSMLLFTTFLLSLFLFTILLIRLNGLSERRRGVDKEDVMLGDEARWAEGREVVEPKVIYDRSGSSRSGRSGGAGGGGGGSGGKGIGVPPVAKGKIVRRQSRGK